MDYYSLNNSYDSQVPYKKQSSPAISQLMRKDKEIEAMREELSQQNYIIDELNYQIQKMEQQLNENEDYRCKYESVLSDFKEAPKLQVPVQQTTAKEIINQFLECNTNDNKEFEVKIIDMNILIKDQLEESLNRERQLKIFIEQMGDKCLANNSKMLEKCQFIYEESQKKYELLQNELFEKECELQFMKDKSLALVDLLQFSGEIMLQYHKLFKQIGSQLKQAFKNQNDQSQQIDFQFKLLDLFQQQCNSIQFKAIIDNLKQPIFKQTYVLNELVNYLGVDNKNVVSHVKQTVKKSMAIEQEHIEIINELQFYKEKLCEQDETIHELEELLTQMENCQKQQLLKENINQQELEQKDELLDHYKELMEQYKNKQINNDNLEEILEYILQVAFGYNPQTEQFFINSIESQKFCKFNRNWNPLVLSQVHKIEQQIIKLYGNEIKYLHEICSHIIGSFTYMEQQLPDQILKQFLNNKSLENVERFFELSYEYVVNQVNLNQEERESYSKYSKYLGRFIGEVIEHQTKGFVRLLREKTYNSLVCDYYPTKL